MSSALLLAAAVATAGTLRPTRDPLPAREVERSLVEPRGWTRLELQLAQRQARGMFGGPPPLEGGAPDRRTGTLALRYGVAPRVELGGQLPWSELSVDGERASGVGDAELWARWALSRAEAPPRSAAVELAVSTPTAAVVDGLPLGTGLTAARAALGGRAAVGALRLTGWLRGTAWLPGHVGWLPTASGHAQWLDAGDRAEADGEALLQAGPLWLRGGAVVGVRGAARLATERDGELQVVDPGALEVAVSGGGAVQLTRGLDLAFLLAAPVVGAGAALLPADPLTPARGTVASLVLGVSL